MLLVCGILGTALAGFLLLLGANQVMTGLAKLLIPDFINTNNAFVADMVRQSPVTMTLSLVVLVPLAEECLFRGLIFTGLLNIFYTPGTVLVQLGVLKITREGLWAAFFMVLRIMMLIAGTFLLTYTTSPIALTDGLEQMLSPLKKLSSSSLTPAPFASTLRKRRSP